MTDDLAQRLRSADGGPARPDHEDIRRRGRRLIATRSTAVLAGIAVVVTGIVGVAAGLADRHVVPAPVIGDPTPTDPTPTGPTPPDATGPDEGTGPSTESEPAGPSQSAEDARRDGVLPEVAALPFDLRVDPDRAASGRGDRRVVSDEGVWVVSRPDPDAAEADGAWTVGDTTGLYGRDFVDLSGYGEVLLLDPDENRILRAFPFPEVAPQALAVTEEAVYCTRQGDGGRPDSMVCRIDRAGFDWIARVFPFDTASPFLDPSETHVPDHWTIDEPVDEPLFGDLRIVDGEVVSVGSTDETRLDPTTLELHRAEEAGSDEVTSRDERLVADFLQLATAPGPQTAAALPFAEEVALGLGSDLHVTRPFAELEDPEAWVIDVEDFRAYVGPFSALELAADTDATDTIVSVGDHPHCVSPPQPPPAEFAELRRVSVQPDLDDDDSCLAWWTVELFVTDDGEIGAVTLDLYEP